MAGSLRRFQRTTMQYDWIPEQARKSLNRVLPEVEEKFAPPPGRKSGRVAAIQNPPGRPVGASVHPTFIPCMGGSTISFTPCSACWTPWWITGWSVPATCGGWTQGVWRNPAGSSPRSVVGIVLYVDLFSDNLAKLKDHIPYFRKLGVNYLHLMPLFAVPTGGERRRLRRQRLPVHQSRTSGRWTSWPTSRHASAMRVFSLVLDFVFNHTSDDHAWAREAQRRRSGISAVLFHIPGPGASRPVSEPTCGISFRPCGGAASPLTRR